MLRVTEPGTIEVKVLPHITLAEALERYRIEEPIDFNKDRRKWQTRAAEDVLGAQDD